MWLARPYETGSLSSARKKTNARVRSCRCDCPGLSLLSVQSWSRPLPDLPPPGRDLALCDAWSMTDRPRYRLRAKGPGLSRFQWWIMGAATLEFAVGLRLAAMALIGGDVGEHVGTLALGGFLMGLSSTTSTLMSLHSRNARGSSSV